MRRRTNGKSNVQKVFEPFNNLLGVAAEKLVEFSQAFPQVSTVATGAGYRYGFGRCRCRRGRVYEGNRYEPALGGAAAAGTGTSGLAYRHVKQAIFQQGTDVHNFADYINFHAR